MEKWYQNWSWLGYINFFILQWFFIRLARYLPSGYKVDGIDIIEHEDGTYSYSQRAYKYYLKYKILKWIVPLTGWWSDYKYIGKVN